MSRRQAHTMHASHGKRELIYGSHRRRSPPKQAYSDPHGKENLKMEINKSLVLPFPPKLTLREVKGRKKKEKERKKRSFGAAEHGAPAARSRAPHLPHGELPIIHPAGKGLRRAAGRRAGIHQVSRCTQVFPPSSWLFLLFFSHLSLFFYPLLGGPFLRQCQVSQPSFPAY